MNKKILAAMILSITCGSASAALMDFDSGSYNGYTYTEGGFTWVSAIEHVHMNYASNGTQALYNHGGGCCSNPYILTANDSSSFSLANMHVDFANANMEFIGSNGNTETIAAGFSGLYTFTGMSNVTSVTWNLVYDQADGQIDNLNIGAAVPVPAAAWLLGSGLLGLIGVARRKAA